MKAGINLFLCWGHCWIFKYVWKAAHPSGWVENNEVLKPNGSQQTWMKSGGIYLTDTTSASVCETVQGWTKKGQRRDVMSDADPHLSGLSDAQTESIIPTSNVPWRDRERGRGFSNSVQDVDNEFDLPLPRGNQLSHTDTHTRKQHHAHSQVQRWKEETAFPTHLCSIRELKRTEQNITKEGSMT